MDAIAIDSMHDQPINTIEDTNTSNGIFPLKVVGKIVSFLKLSRHQGTVAKCARACKAWLSICRERLYDNIVIDDRRRWKKFNELLSQPLVGDIERYLWAIKELHINTYPQGEPRERWIQAERQQLTKLLTSYAPHLRGLNFLRLEGLIWSGPSLGDLSIVSGDNFYGSLTCLQLHECTFVDFNPLYDLLVRLPALSDLSLRTISFICQKALAVADIPPGQGPRLSHLEIYFCDTMMLRIPIFLVKMGMTQRLSRLTWSPQTSDRSRVGFEHVLQSIEPEALKALICRNPVLFPLKGKLDHSEPS